MAGFADIPIRTKLLLISAFSSASALLLAGIVILIYDTVTYRAQKTQESTVQAEILAASLGPAVVFADKRAAEEYLRALEANPEISAAAVYSADGKVFAAYSRSPTAPDEIPASSEPSGQRLGDGRIEIFTSIKEGSHAVGAVYLRASVESLRSRIARVGGVILFMLAGSLLITLPISMRMQRAISVPIQEISSAASSIAAGDLTARLARSDRADEIGVLSGNFASMAQHLRDHIRALMDGANVLGTAASHIVASTGQMAGNAADSAAAMAQTMVTVQEVRQTAQLASDKAKMVSDSAQKAAEISQTGRAATDQAVAGMGRIQVQVEAIAESMSRLTQESQTITQIVAAVEDLASQSNLLAVNAGIEAARAGEHGKGFGVVAQEVKHLAEESRKATNQVRSSLGAIQNAAAIAARATDAGAQAVAAGILQAEAAGQAIQALAAGVNEAAQAARQIAASSQQQFVGVDQVAGAMASISQASTQNLESATQLDAEARNLNELSSRLKQMVEQYKV